MRFEQALSAIRLGKKIRRTSIPDKEMQLHKGTLVRMKKGIISQVFENIKNEDIFAEDWEIVEDPAILTDLEQAVKRIEEQVKNLENEVRRIKVVNDFDKYVKPLHFGDLR